MGRHKLELRSEEYFWTASVYFPLYNTLFRVCRRDIVISFLKDWKSYEKL